MLRLSKQAFARRDAGGNVVASVTNAGNVHYKVAAIRLHAGHTAPVDAATPTAERAFGTVVFPGEARSFQLRPQRPAQASPAGSLMTLEVVTDRGIHYVPLDVALN